MAVTVDPAGRVVLAAPEGFATSRLDAVVRRKAPWIMQRLRRAQARDRPPAPREFVSGESVLYLGRHYRLKVTPQPPDGARDPRLRGSWLHVPAPAGPEQTARVREALITWFRRHAAERLPERVAEWQPRAGVPLPCVVIASRNAGEAATGTARSG